MLKSVHEMHATLRSEMHAPPQTQCSLFNSMAHTIGSDIHRNALFQICEEHMFVRPIAYAVLLRFRAQHQRVLKGERITDVEGTVSDEKWENNIRSLIKTFDIESVRNQLDNGKNSVDNCVDLSICDMLASSLHVDAMFQMCRRYRLARKLVECRLLRLRAMATGLASELQ
jgi:hypothetical protein